VGVGLWVDDYSTTYNYYCSLAFPRALTQVGAGWLPLLPILLPSPRRVVIRLAPSPSHTTYPTVCVCGTL
jgi:hypothetical protein